MSFVDYCYEHNGSSFAMLTEHLYEQFMRYITNGRDRAPPEMELYDMLPTFQSGAKTDRRALQSKFKSWAKRMHIENGNLTLSNTGKLIIPQEKCDALVIELHSDEHHSVDKIISQIQNRYTWTRKNFGMDRDVVVNAISNYCKKDECRKRLRLEYAARNLRNSSPLSPSIYNQSLRMMSNSLAFYPPYPYHHIRNRAPPMPPMFSPFGYVPHPGFLQPPALLGQNTRQMFDFSAQRAKSVMPFFWNDPQNLPINTQHYQSTNFTASVAPKPYQETNFNTSTLAPQYSGSLNKTTEAAPKVHANTPAKASNKPKNMYAFIKLLKASQKHPKDYPTILMSEKTKFLCVVGLVPKSLCSSNTLRRFEKEFKYQQVLNTARLRYIAGKGLRDKNKLKKSLNNKPHARTYLRMLAEPRLAQRNCFEKVKRWYKCENSIVGKTKCQNASNADDNGKKITKIRITRVKTPEIIDITSSDDDTSQVLDGNSKSTVSCKAASRKCSWELKKIQNIAHKRRLEDFELSKENSFSYENKPFKNNRVTYTYSKMYDEIKKEKMYSFRDFKANIGEDMQSLCDIKPAVDEDNRFQLGDINQNIGEDMHSFDNIKPNIGEGDRFPLGDINQNIGEGMHSFDIKRNIGAETKQSNKFTPNDCNLNYQTLYHRNSNIDYHNILNSENKYLDKNGFYQKDILFKPYAISSCNKSEESCVDALRFRNNALPLRISEIVPDRKVTNHSLQNAKNLSEMVNSNKSVSSPLIIRPAEVATQNKNLGVLHVQPTKGNGRKIIVLDKLKSGNIIIIPPNQRMILPKGMLIGKPRLETNSTRTDISKMVQFSKSDTVSETGLANSATENYVMQNDDILPKDPEIANVEKKLDMNYEMDRITKWIQKVKGDVYAGIFQQGLHKTLQKLDSQLDVGLSIIRQARRTLLDIEKSNQFEAVVSQALTKQFETIVEDKTKENPGEQLQKYSFSNI